MLKLTACRAPVALASAHLEPLPTTSYGSSYCMEVNVLTSRVQHVIHANGALMHVKKPSH
jgi:hypothetical protein